jgi:putative transposase
VWQEGSHPQEIYDEKMLIQKIEYIHNNPVDRGYVDDPEHWRYSSAINYAVEEGLIEVKTDWRN